MKIGNKLLLANMTITILSMLVLSFILSGVINQYIMRNIEKDLLAQNILIEPMISAGKDLIYLNKEKSPVLSLVFEKETLIFVSKGKDFFKNNDLNELLNLPLNKINQLKISGKNCIAYSHEFNLNGKAIIGVTLIYNNDINEISKQILAAVLSSVAVIAVIIILLTKIFGQMITKPIHILVKSAEKFSQKRFSEKAVIKSKDEFLILAEAMNKMADSLNKQDLEQRRFYENISHELKTPLTVISGYAQGIKTDIIDNKDEALDIIADECGKLKKQLENIIYLSKLDTVKENFNPENICLNDIVSDVFNRLYSLIVMGDIDIVFNPSESYYIYADKEKITRLFINIFTNCIKYTNDMISIEIKNSADYIEVKISDNGPGFSEALLQNPFNRSAQGEKDGSGIGLSIVKKITDLHDGVITLSNHADGGAQYTIKLLRKK